jgi:hypothetical protein
VNDGPEEPTYTVELSDGTKWVLPICCNNPDPAYLMGAGSAPGTRTQGIDCTTCGAKLVRLTWPV